MPAIPRPEPRKRVKARKQRHAARVVKSIRAQCVERDGHCRAARDLGVTYGCDWFLFCDGPSEWAHLGEKRRFKTRGQTPERRHTTAGSLMLCQHHHRAYDAARLVIEAGADGADGPLRFAVRP
jgi:hypothetical protein